MRMIQIKSRSIRQPVAAAIFAVAGLSLLPQLALAQTTSSSSSATNVGSAIQSFLSNLTSSFPTAISGAAFILGVYMVVAGTWSLARRGQDDRNSPPMAHSVYLILGGAAMSMLVTLTNTNISTLLNGATAYAGNSAATAGSTTTCISTSSSSGASSTAMECMLQNIGTNVISIAVEALFVGCYFISAIVTITTLYGLAMSRRRSGYDEPKNWQVKLIGCAMLGNVPSVMTMLAGTLGLSSVVTTSGYQGVTGSTASTLLTYTPTSGTTASLEQFAQVITWVFVILSGFGVFYTVGGIFMLMNPDDNRHTKTKACIHIFAGCLLANIQATVTLITSTLGINMGL